MPPVRVLLQRLMYTIKPERYMPYIVNQYHKSDPNNTTGNVCNESLFYPYDLTSGKTGRIGNGDVYMKLYKDYPAWCHSTENIVEVSKLAINYWKSPDNYGQRDDTINSGCLQDIIELAKTQHKIICNKPMYRLVRDALTDQHFRFDSAKLDTDDYIVTTFVKPIRSSKDNENDEDIIPASIFYAMGMKDDMSSTRFIVRIIRDAFFQIMVYLKLQPSIGSVWTDNIE